MSGAAERIPKKATGNHFSVFNSQDITMARKPIRTAPSPGQPLDGQGVWRISPFKVVKSNLRISTWNVRSFFAAGKLSNAIKKMKRMRIKFIRISELRWPGVGTCAHEGGTLYFSGSADDDRRHSNGVGIRLIRSSSNIWKDSYLSRIEPCYSNCMGSHLILISYRSALLLGKEIRWRCGSLVWLHQRHTSRPTKWQRQPSHGRL